MLIKPIPPGHAGFDRITEAVTTEFGQLMDLVRQALREKLRTTPGVADYYCDVSAIYPDRVVSRVAGRLMAYPYTLNADNTVTVGDGAEGIGAVMAIMPPVKPGNDIVAIRRDGKTEYYKVDDKLVYRALSGLYRSQMSSWVKPLAAIKQKPDLTDWRDARLGQVAPASTKVLVRVIDDFSAVAAVCQGLHG